MKSCAQYIQHSEGLPTLGEELRPVQAVELLGRLAETPRSFIFRPNVDLLKCRIGIPGEGLLRIIGVGVEQQASPRLVSGLEQFPRLAMSGVARVRSEPAADVVLP